MTKLNRRILLAGAFLAAAALSAPAMAQSVKLDMHEYFGPTNLSGSASADFAERVAKKTNGDVAVNVHYSGSLGLGEADILKTVEEGVVPLSTSMVDKMLGTISVASIQSVPFVASTIDDSIALFSAFKPYLEKQFAEQNQMLLFEVISLPDGIWSKKPIPDIATLRTLKTRTNSPLATKTFSNAGATAVPMAWGDVAPGLVTGVIDSVITTDDNGITAHLYEQMSDFTRLNMSTAFWIVHVNKDVFDGLTPEQQSAILEAATESRDAAYERARKRLAENSAVLTSKGVRVAETITVDLREGLIAAAAPLKDEWAQKVGPDVSAAVLAAYEQAKKASNSACDIDPAGQTLARLDSREGS